MCVAHFVHECICMYMRTHTPMVDPVAAFSEGFSVACVCCPRSCFPSSACRLVSPLCFVAIFAVGSRTSRVPRLRFRVAGVAQWLRLPSGVRFFVSRGLPYVEASVPHSVSWSRATRCCELAGTAAPRRMPCRTYSLSFSPSRSCAGVAAKFPRTAWTMEWRTGPLWGMHFFDVRLLLRHHVCHDDCSYRVCLAPIAGLPPGQ